MLGVPPESYRTWDAGRRVTPPKMLARARALATHRDDHALLPLPVLALLIGVHVKTLRAAARDGRLPVTYDTRTTFRRLRGRATLAAARQFRHSYFGRQVRRADRREPPSWASVPADYDVQIRALRRARGVEPGAIGHAGGRGAEGPSFINGRRANVRRRPCSGNASPRSSRQRPARDNRIGVSQAQRAALIGAANNTVVYQWEAARTRVPPWCATA